MTVSEAFETLGIAPTVDGDVIRASYRRLAFELHPDRNKGDAGSVGRFKRVVRAYAVLNRKLRLEKRPMRDANRAGECPKCGKFTTLLPGLDGGHACADCLTTWGRRMLPAPPTVVASCAFAASAMVVALAELAAFVRTGLPVCGVAALAASVAVVLSTAITCIMVVEVARPHELGKRARSSA